MPDQKVAHLNKEFEQAVDAVIHGDVETLKSLIKAYPALVRTHSTREHHGTLLHYVAANGVENERQKTPPNILEVTRLLLEAGADPNAMGDMYNSSSVMTALVSSAHPAQAGKQADLVKLLCEFGANPNGVKDDGLPLKTAIAFRYTKAIQALVECGARVDNVVFAAAIGDLDKVKQYAATDVPKFVDAFNREIREKKQVLEFALTSASMAGQLDVVKFLCNQDIDINSTIAVEETTALSEAALTHELEVARYLLEKGADVKSQDHQDFTALHWAAWHQHLEMEDLLLAYHAPLEARNSYGGTVLDTFVYHIMNAYYPVADPLPTLKKLVEAGADVMAVEPFPTGNQIVDDYLTPLRK